MVLELRTNMRLCEKGLYSHVSLIWTHRIMNKIFSDRNFTMLFLFCPFKSETRTPVYRQLFWGRNWEIQAFVSPSSVARIYGSKTPLKVYSFPIYPFLLSSFVFFFFFCDLPYRQGVGPGHQPPKAKRRGRHCPWTACGTQARLRLFDLANSVGLVTEAFCRLACSNGSAPDVTKVAKSWHRWTLASPQRLQVTWLKSPDPWRLKDSTTILGQWYKFLKYQYSDSANPT